MADNLMLKDLPFELKEEVNFEQSTFEGYSAGIGNRDSMDDIIQPGSFTTSIRERVARGKVKWLDQHSHFSTRNLWGVITNAREEPVDAVEQAAAAGATHRLWTLFQGSKADPDAQIALGKINERILDALSIGFRPIKVDFEADDEDGEEDPEWAWFFGLGVRNIWELAWWETSSVIWGANSAAMVIPGTVKGIIELLEGSVLAADGDVSDDEVRRVLSRFGETVKELRVHPETLFRLEAEGAVPGMTNRVEKALRTLDAKGVGGSNRDKIEALRDHFVSVRKDVWGGNKTLSLPAVSAKSANTADPAEPGGDGADVIDILTVLNELSENVKTLTTRVGALETGEKSAGDDATASGGDDDGVAPEDAHGSGEEPEGRPETRSTSGGNAEGDEETATDADADEPDADAGHDPVDVDGESEVSETELVETHMADLELMAMAINNRDHEMETAP